jgi:hypothetical protein
MGGIPPGLAAAILLGQLDSVFGGPVRPAYRPKPARTPDEKATVLDRRAKRKQQRQAKKRGRR